MSRLKYEFQARYIIIVNYIPRFNFVYKLQCFQRFLKRKKKTYKEFLVSHLVKISKELIPDFYWSKNHWNKVYDYSESICYFWINILFAVSVPQVHVNTLNSIAHLFSSHEYLVNLSISVVVLREYALNKCITMSPSCPPGLQVWTMDWAMNLKLFLHEI